MPLWAQILIAVVSLLLVTGIGVLTWFGWKTYERRALMRIVVRTEAVEAAAQALVDAFGRLADASDETLRTFADDPESSERRALHEVAVKAEMTTDELDRMKLPKSLVSVAEAVADAAFLIARETRLLGENDTGDEALDHMTSIDLGTIRLYTAQARRRVHEACAECGLEETNVYGGGLYL